MTSATLTHRHPPALATARPRATRRPHAPTAVALLLSFALCLAATFGVIALTIQLSTALSATFAFLTALVAVASLLRMVQRLLDEPEPDR